MTRTQLADLLAGRTERLKTALTDQTLMAGIGNAYSDEIMHTARLSPYATAGSCPRRRWTGCTRRWGRADGRGGRSVGQSAAS